MMPHGWVVQSYNEQCKVLPGWHLLHIWTNETWSLSDIYPTYSVILTFQIPLILLFSQLHASHFGAAAGFVKFIYIHLLTPHLMSLGLPLLNAVWLLMVIPLHLFISHALKPKKKVMIFP